MEPGTLMALASIGSSVGSGIYRAINPDRQQQILGDVLNQQTQFRDMLARQAFGNFTAAERQQIQMQSQQQVNQVAAGISQRGLGGSGAGAQIIAGAQQAPFFAAQERAQAGLQGANIGLLQGAQMLGKSASLSEDLGAIAREWTLLAENNQINNELASFVDTLQQTGVIQYDQPIGPGLEGSPGAPGAPQGSVAPDFNPFAGWEDFTTDPWMQDQQDAAILPFYDAWNQQIDYSSWGSLLPKSKPPQSKPAPLPKSNPPASQRPNYQNPYRKPYTYEQTVPYGAA